MSKEQQINKLNQIFQQIIDENPTLRNLYTTRSPRYVYFQIKGSNDEYFYTTETVIHNSKKRYASGCYKYIKSKREWKLTKERYHAKMKDARLRALTMKRIACGEPLPNAK